MFNTLARGGTGGKYLGGGKAKKLMTKRLPPFLVVALKTRVLLITASDHIELHLTMSDHVCKREIVISKAKPKNNPARS